MNLEQILKLGEMGFTKEEILKMAMATEPDKQPEQEPEKEQEQEPEQQPQNESLSTGINALLQDMHETLKGIQNANIQNSRMPEVEAKKPEDILAEVIYPTYKKEG